MDQQDIVVNQGEMIKADYPDILRSGGLGPCIAIAVYDPRTRSGYMMHASMIRWDGLDDKIREIRRDYGTLSRLRVYAAGNSLCSYDDEEQREFEKSDRVYLEGKLREYFSSSQARIRWIPDDHIAELILDTSTGKFELETNRLDEMFEY